MQQLTSETRCRPQPPLTRPIGPISLSPEPSASVHDAPALPDAPCSATTQPSPDDPLQTQASAHETLQELLKCFSAPNVDLESLQQQLQASPAAGELPRAGAAAIAQSAQETQSEDKEPAVSACATAGADADSGDGAMQVAAHSLLDLRVDAVIAYADSAPTSPRRGVSRSRRTTRRSARRFNPRINNTGPATGDTPPRRRGTRKTYPELVPPYEKLLAAAHRASAKAAQGRPRRRGTSTRPHAVSAAPANNPPAAACGEYLGDPPTCSDADVAVCYDVFKAGERSQEDPGGSDTGDLAAHKASRLIDLTDRMHRWFAACPVGPGASHAQLAVWHFARSTSTTQLPIQIHVRIAPESAASVPTGAPHAAPPASSALPQRLRFFENTKIAPFEAGARPGGLASGSFATAIPSAASPRTGATTEAMPGPRPTLADHTEVLPIASPLRKITLALESGTPGPSIRARRTAAAGVPRDVLEAMPTGCAYSKEELQELYLLPIEEAAQTLGMGVTLLKQLCRHYNITRWPQRKLASVDKIIALFEKSLAENPSFAGNTESRSVLAHLRARRQEIFEDPNTELDTFTKQIRQATLKAQHTMRAQQEEAAWAASLNAPERETRRTGSRARQTRPDSGTPGLADAEDHAGDDMRGDEDCAALEAPQGGRNTTADGSSDLLAEQEDRFESPPRSAHSSLLLEAAVVDEPWPPSKPPASQPLGRPQSASRSTHDEDGAAAEHAQVGTSSTVRKGMPYISICSSGRVADAGAAANAGGNAWLLGEQLRVAASIGLSLSSVANATKRPVSLPVLPQVNLPRPSQGSTGLRDLLKQLREVPTITASQAVAMESQTMTGAKRPGSPSTAPQPPEKSLRQGT